MISAISKVQSCFEIVSNIGGGYNTGKKKCSVRIEISVTDIVNGYRVLVDFEFDMIFEDREGGEHGAGRHAGRFATALPGAKITLP